MKNEKKNPINDIVTSLCVMGKSYNLALTHSINYGIDTSDIIDDLVREYKNEIVPAMIALSEEEKKELIKKINKKIRSKDPDLNINVLKNSIAVLTGAYEVEETKEEEVEIDDEEENEIKMSVTDIFTQLCSLGKSYKDTNGLKNNTDFNIKEVLEQLIEKYDDVLVPAINSLSDEEKTELLGRIDEILKIQFKAIDPIFFNRVKSIIGNKVETAKICSILG